MAKEEKKSVALDLSVYIKLSKLAADLRSANPGGGFVSMSVAVGRLLDAYEEMSEIKAMQKADFELENATQPVIIKQSDGALYLEKMLAHNHNAYLTPLRNEAMIFDSREQATAFLHKCGHEIGNWIIEPM
jgi:hypothetical protein